MSGVRKSLLYSLGQQYLQTALNLTSFIVLARLLTPEDIGLFSVASAVIGLAQVVRDFGVVSYLIQERELTEKRIRTAFTITLLLALSLFCLLQLLAPYAAQFYDDKRMEMAFAVLSLSFLIVPFNSTTLAILRREMRFDVLFRINTVATATSVICGIVMAYHGFGYISLLWASIAQTLATSIGGIIYRKHDFFLKPTLCEFRRVYAYGSRLVLASAINQLSTSANDLITGKLLGFTTVGMISRGMGVMNLIHRDVTAAIRNVALPAFSLAIRNNQDLEDRFIYSVSAWTSIAWPIYGFLGIYSLACIRMLFGDQWDPSAPLVPWFCLAGAVAAIASLIPTLITAHGRANTLLRVHLLLDPAKILAILIVLYHYRSAEAFAITIFAIFIISTPILFYFKNTIQPTNYSVLMINLLHSLVITGICLTIPLGVSIFYDHPGHVLPPIPLIMTGLTIPPIWLIAVVYTSHPTAKDPEFQNAIKRIGIHHAFREKH